ncbi:transporter (plasmid) [Photobacterium sp. DA100]|uniref:SphA family protein n=1 Tax=Photobacterium sp. DA100 TaxID=3027472 RepID=UPI00247876E2|nr:transporter [Photobacterium sp. DA100]WEM45516.1 transporter [Photobacterium sp. DA100]
MVRKQLITAIILAGTAFTAAADGLNGSGHYTPGVGNIRDFTMPDQAGFIYEQYNLYYASDDFKDRNGNSIGQGQELTTGAVAPLLMWVTDKEILGARYSFYINPSYVNTEMDNQGVGGGVGDLYVQPLWLGWLNEQYDVTLGAGVYIPIGDDDVTLDMWTAQVQAAGYYYFMDKASALMLAATYEFHGESDATGVKPGDHLTLEYGYSQYLTQQLEIGIRGYSQWQTESDSLPADMKNVNHMFGTSLGEKSEVHALGLQVGYWFNSNWNITANYSKEYSASARYEGEIFSLNLTYSGNPVY